MSDWKKYPDISRIEPSEITLELVKGMIDIIKDQGNIMVITPVSLMSLNGVPVSENSWLLSQKLRIKKLKVLLDELKNIGLLEERKSKQDFKGKKEKGYNIIR